MKTKAFTGIIFVITCVCGLGCSHSDNEKDQTDKRSQDRFYCDHCDHFHHHHHPHYRTYYSERRSEPAAPAPEGPQLPATPKLPGVGL